MSCLHEYVTDGHRPIAPESRIERCHLSVTFSFAGAIYVTVDKLLALGLVLGALACSGSVGGGSGGDGGTDGGGPPSTTGSYTATSAACAAEPLQIADWKPNTAYVYGQPVIHAGGVYRVSNIEGGTSASTSSADWPKNSPVTDGALTWTYADDAQGPIYYACDCRSSIGMEADTRCQPGDDTDGTSPAHAWTSLSKIQNALNSLPAGATLALCRGGVFSWNTETRIENSKCTPTNPCTVRDYVDPRWDTDGTGAVTNTNEGSTWKMPAITATAPADEDRRVLWLKGFRGGSFRFLNLYMKSDGSTWMAYGIDPARVTVCGGVVDNFMEMVQGNGEVFTAGDLNGVPAPDGCATKNCYATVMGVRSVNNSGQGALIGGDHVAIMDNYFYNNGYGVTGTVDKPNESDRLHSIYLGHHAGTTPAVGMRISGNEIYRNSHHTGPNQFSPRDVTDDGTACLAVPIVIHGATKDLLIENNLIYEEPGTAGGGCWGIGIDSGGYGDTDIQFDNTVIRRNRIYNVGNTAIEVSQCPDCIVEDNLIVAGASTRFATDGIHTAWQKASDVGTTHETTRLIIRNNTFYYAPGMAGIAIYLGDEGTGHVVSNNAVYLLDNGTIPSWGSWCFRVELADPRNDIAGWDYNLCALAAETDADWEFSRSLADWRALRFDIHSKDVAPQFTNVDTDPTKADFTPQAGSPLVDAGDPAAKSYWPFDLTGASRTDGKPDIGAYERR